MIHDRVQFSTLIQHFELCDSVFRRVSSAHKTQPQAVESPAGVQNIVVLRHHRKFNDMSPKTT